MTRPDLPPALSDLSLDDLRDLMDGLIILEKIGIVAAAEGWPPRFDLRPGRTARIKLGWAMPEAMPEAGRWPYPPAPVVAVARGDEMLGGERGGLQRHLPAEDDPVQAAERVDAPDPAAAEAQSSAGEVRADEHVDDRMVDPPGEAGADETMAGASMGTDAPADPEPEPMPVPEPAPEPAPVQVPDAKPQRPVPGSARALVEKVRAAAWTAEEDAQLVAAVVQSRLRGASQRDAIVAIAAELKRPVPGAEFRVRHKLADRIAAEVEITRKKGSARIAAEAARKGPAVPPISSSPAAGGPATGAPPEPPSHKSARAALQAALPADMSPIEAHLAGLPRGGDWTIERDRALVGLLCLGWDFSLIANELGCDTVNLRQRYDKLTGLDPKTKQRRWGREELKAGFARLLPAQD